MANFAVLENENIINTIVADSKSIAEELTGKTCIEFTTEHAEVGGKYINGTFIRRKPYPSWVLNASNKWESPTPYPEIDQDNPKSYTWDEPTVSWVEA